MAASFCKAFESSKRDRERASDGIVPEWKPQKSCWRDAIPLSAWTSFTQLVNSWTILAYENTEWKQNKIYKNVNKGYKKGKKEKGQLTFVHSIRISITCAWRRNSRKTNTNLVDTQDVVWNHDLKKYEIETHEAYEDEIDSTKQEHDSEWSKLGNHGDICPPTCFSNRFNKGRSRFL